jgi:hypothetical protein
MHAQWYKDTGIHCARAFFTHSSRARAHAPAADDMVFVGGCWANDRMRKDVRSAVNAVAATETAAAGGRVG